MAQAYLTFDIGKNESPSPQTNKANHQERHDKAAIKLLQAVMDLSGSSSPTITDAAQ